MCGKHAQRFYRYGDVAADFTKKRNKCTIDKCDKWVFGHGHCPMHYWRFTRHGDPLYVRPSNDLRYHTRYEKRGPNECWPWKYGRDKNGYGKFIDGRAHRFGWELLHGKIPEGIFVCHKCDNPPCQNPAHLFLGNAKENMIDKVNKNRLVVNPYRDEKTQRFTFKPS